MAWNGSTLGRFWRGIISPGGSSATPAGRDNPRARRFWFVAAQMPHCHGDHKAASQPEPPAAPIFIWAAGVYTD